MMVTLPDCPLCGQKADPRWLYKGHEFCDGCCPDERTSAWVVERCDHAIKQVEEIARLHEALVDAATRAVAVTRERDAAFALIHEICLEADLWNGRTPASHYRWDLHTRISKLTGRRP